MATAGNVVLNLDNTALAAASSSDFPQIAVFVDNAAPVVTQLTGTTASETITLAASLGAGVHHINVMFKSIGAATGDRWVTPVLSIKVLGVTAPLDATFGPATVRTSKMAVFGDSIAEGKYNLGTTQLPADTDAGYSWVHFLAAGLDCEVGVVGFGGTAYGTTGPNNLPSFANSFAYYSSGRSRLVSTQLSPVPDRVIIAIGEYDTTGGSLTATVTSSLASVRAATTAPIIVLVPFSGKVRSDITAATLPALSKIVDVNNGFGDGSHLLYYPSNQTPSHPTIAGSAYLAPRIEKIIRSGISKTARSVMITLTSDGSTPLANLTGLSWSFFDQNKVTQMSVPADSGTGTTTSDGYLIINPRTSLASGATGYLVVTDSDGTTTQSPPAKAYSGPVVIS